MSDTAQFTDRTDDAEGRDSGDGKGKVHRLLDILTQEVSLVNRAANRQRWLVRKGSSDMVEVTENADGTLTSQPVDAPASGDETVVGKELDGQEPEGDDLSKQVTLPDGVKQALGAACKSIVVRLQALAGKLKEATEEEGAEEPTAVLMELKNIAMLIGGAMSKYPSPVSGGKGKEPEGKAEGASEPASDAEAAGVGKAAYVLPPGYKAKLLAAVEQALRAVGQAVERLGGAEAGEAGSAPMPKEIAAPLQAAHDGLMAAYEMGAKSKKAKPEDEEEEKTAKAQSPAQMLKEVDSTLAVVMAKLQPGKPLDEDVYQRLDKLRSVVSSSLKSKGDEPDGEPAKHGTEKADVEKAGAKMSVARRKRFQEAIKTLIDLFKEVIPASELGKMPHLFIKKADEPPPPDPVVTELREQLAKTEGLLAAVRQEVTALRQAPVESNVQPVSVPRAAPGGKVQWPNDLNSLRE